MHELVEMRGHNVADQGEEHVWSQGSFYCGQKEVYESIKELLVSDR